MVAGELRPWREVLRNARKRLEAGTRMKPVIELPCAMVLSLARNGNGLLNVRCHCMAGTVNKPRSRYYNYDPLGTARTIPQAREVWDAHVAAKGEDHGREQAN